MARSGARSGVGAPRSSSLVRRVFMKLRGFFLPGNEEKSLRERLRLLAGMRDARGERLSQVERHMLMNTLSFGETQVADVMVPRADIVGMDIEVSLDELLKETKATAHSRMPLYRETLDNPVGMVHIKDVITWFAHNDREREEFRLSDLRRNVLVVPPSMRALNLLLKMQSTRIHLALVIDEYGGTDGLVTIEDLIEEIVGEIEDEHDTREGPALLWVDEKTILADARAPVKDLEALIGRHLLAGETEDEIDTLGGLVFFEVDRVPQRGELITHSSGLEFEIVDADPRRIKRLTIRVPDGNPKKTTRESGKEKKKGAV